MTHDLLVQVAYPISISEKTTFPQVQEDKSWHFMLISHAENDNFNLQSDLKISTEKIIFLPSAWKGFPKRHSVVLTVLYVYM